MKLCNYLSASILFAVSLVVLEPAMSEITPGVLQEHAANNTIVWSWFSYVPANISKSELCFIMITGQNGNLATDDYKAITEMTRWLASTKMNAADIYGFVNLTPVIPRNTNYTVAFARDSFLETTDSFEQRADLKINLMIDALTKMLREDGYNVHDKVFLEGFSAGGGFALRYTILWPDRIQAMTAGGVVDPTLPAISYNGTSCDWPVGVNDFLPLAGHPFRRYAYLQVPQFIYIGELDKNSNIYIPGNNELLTDEQIYFVNENFGGSDGNDPLRLNNICNYMKSLGCNITIKIYPDTGHELTSKMYTDALDFLQQHKSYRFEERRMITTEPILPLLLD